LGRRRRRVIRIVKKKLPTVFMCPRCGEEAVRVTIAKDTGKAVVLCAMCQLKDEFQAHPAAQAIDVYSYFTDKFYGVKDPRPIIPKERAIPRFHAEEEKAPEMPEPAMAEEPVLDTAQEAKITPETTALSTQEAPTSIVETPTASEESPAPVTEASESEMEESPSPESQEAKEEEEEPFADILENKDKKRYSSTPVPQESSESGQSAE
jgi:transcription elongation factor Elf1